MARTKSRQNSKLSIPIAKLVPYWQELKRLGDNFRISVLALEGGMKEELDADVEFMYSVSDGYYGIGNPWKGIDVVHDTELNKAISGNGQKCVSTETQPTATTQEPLQSSCIKCNKSGAGLEENEELMEVMWEHRRRIIHCNDVLKHDPMNCGNCAMIESETLSRIIALIKAVVPKKKNRKHTEECDCQYNTNPPCEVADYGFNECVDEINNLLDGGK